LEIEDNKVFTPGAQRMIDSIEALEKYGFSLEDCRKIASS